MKYIKMFWIDFKNGILKNVLLFLCPMILAVFTFWDAWNRIHGVKEINLSLAAYGDYWFYVYGGMQKYVPGPGNRFQVPIIWMVVFILPAFLLLNYPVKDMQHMGTQMMVRIGGRTRWWLSKCMWNVLATVLYHVLLAGILLGLCFVFNIPLSSRIHVELLGMLFNLFGGNTLLPREMIPTVIFLIPILCSVAFNLLQMTLCLFIKPIFSFFVTAVLLVSSAYLLSPYMLGNYAMPLRYSWIFEGGVSFQVGIVASVLLAVVAVIIGMIRFRKYEILNRD